MRSAPQQLEMAAIVPGPETINLTGWEMVTLESRLRAEGRYIFAAERRGARWTVHVLPLPNNQLRYEPK